MQGEIAEEVIRELEEGKSYERVSQKYGIPKATLYRKHIGWLKSKKEKAEEGLERIEKNLKIRKKEFEQLESKYNKKLNELEGKYRKKEDELKARIEKLRSETKEIRGVLERKGIQFEEGISILKEVTDLRDEKEKLNSEIEEMKAVIFNLEEEIDRLELAVREKEKERVNLQHAYNFTFHNYNALKNEVSGLQVYRISLETSVKELESRLADLEEKIEEREEELKRLRKEVEDENELIENLKAERKEIERIKEKEKKKIISEVSEIVEEAKRISNKIIESAEKERKAILREAEKEKERISRSKEAIRRANFAPNFVPHPKTELLERNGR